MSSRSRVILIIIGVLVIGFVVLQLIPAGSISSQFARTNPPVQSQIEWNSPETEQLMRTACYDCHSNETVWPWYGQLAPVAWLVAKDVNEGREALNFSVQTANDVEAEELIDEIREGSMPPRSYTILHPDANLSQAQKDQLIAGIQASLHGEGEAGGERNEGRDDDD